MAFDRLVSPGVFTRENDQSFLPQGIAEIGGAFIGPTSIGPAFVPTIVESATEFRTRFGDPTPDFYLGHAAMDYLADAARATIVRVLGTEGWAYEGAGAPVLLELSGGVDYPFALLQATRDKDLTTANNLFITTASLSQTSPIEFSLDITNSIGATSSYASMSVIPTDANYYPNIIGSGPDAPGVAFVQLAFPRAALAEGGSVTGSSVLISSSSAIYNFSGSAIGGYSAAETPWIQSQTAYSSLDLFKVHTFADGTSANRDIKIGITSIRPANSTSADQHGTFSVIVRLFGDTDNRVSLVEQYDNLTLDPTSPDYIVRRIGDTRWAFDANDELVQLGDYASNSRYIWIEITPSIDALVDKALPVGFAAPRQPVFTSNTPSASFVTTRFELTSDTSSSIDNIRTYYGWDFSDDTNLTFSNPIPENAAVVGTGFSLETSIVDTDVTASVAGGLQTLTNLKKFSIPFQYGNDGLYPSRVLATAARIRNTNTQGFDLSTSTAAGSVAYNKALQAISNSEAFDINLIIMPGVLYQYHPYVCQLAIDVCEARGDCFYIMDGFAFGQSVDTAVTTVAGADTNYAGVYHPWVKILDVHSNRLLWVPPSTVLPGVYAFNDKVAAEWYAPAGLNRGGIDVAVQVEKRLTRVNRDDLYDGRINPIAQFPGQGIVAYGQKTLQVKSSALDRINVRRLLIAVKKFIASSARFLVFEQNVEATRQRFLNIANPYLASVQERSGLYAFKVIMDESNNTSDLIDRNILVGQIYLQPTRTAEFITLEFNVLPTGAVFPDGA